MAKPSLEVWESIQFSRADTVNPPPRLSVNGTTPEHGDPGLEGHFQV